MKINYVVTENKYEAYNAYGILCVCENDEIEAEDISPNRAAVERLAALLEREGVEQVHFWDVLSDLLAEHAAEL